MKLSVRPFKSMEDYWRIRTFLREVFLLNQRREVSWTLARFDYWFWAGIQCFEREWFKFEESIFLWETGDGRLAAVLNPEGRGEVFLQVHPEFCTPDLLAEMLEMAEKHLTNPQPDGSKQMQVWAVENDVMLHQALEARGYMKSEESEAMRRRAVDLPFPESSLPLGYTIRSLRYPEDLKDRSHASLLAFHPDETEPDPFYLSGEWIWIFQQVPLFRGQLDLIVTAPDGKIAAFCTVWYDDVTRTGYFEPVGTHPDHQRKGLGKAIMYEGLRRLKTLGADLALVGSYSDQAGGLYASVGFTEFDLLEPWAKKF